MFNIHREELLWLGKKLVLETGKAARQADSAVTVYYGDTIVLCTVVADKRTSHENHFLPLSVHYQEKAFAAGKIRGGFVKRQGKPSEDETLIARIIDRSIRPLFPDGFYHECQVICTVLSYQRDHSPDVAAVIGASAALSLAGIPFDGPLAGARIASIGYDEWVINPSYEQRQNMTAEIFVSGTQDEIFMIEGETQEYAPNQVLEAVKQAHEAYQPVIEMIQRLKEQAGKPSWDWQDDPSLPLICEKIEAVGKDRVVEALKHQDRYERRAAVSHIREALKHEILEPSTHSAGLGATLSTFDRAFNRVMGNLIRQQLIEHNLRLDGRSPTQIRPITAEVGLLPRTHGSALFTRGLTQVLAVVTLGTPKDAQVVEGLDNEHAEPFMLHYNFLPFCVGEVDKVGSPGRREIGHGNLALKALRPLVQVGSSGDGSNGMDHTIQVVAEVLESNGSSSMATVCAATLALKDAGIPLKGTGAGIAMGLMTQGDKAIVLSDITGGEDSMGEMDFKVAGSARGITAIQLDVKKHGLSYGLLSQALDQATQGYLSILKIMDDVLKESRPEMSAHAPRMRKMRIPADRVRDIIGPGGRVIREIVKTTGAQVDLTDEGLVTIAAPDAQAMENAAARIAAISMDPTVGDVYTGKVVKVIDAGSFVNIGGTRDGFVHHSAYSRGGVDKLNTGDSVKVKVVGFDIRNKMKLELIERISAHSSKI